MSNKKELSSEDNRFTKYMVKHGYPPIRLYLNLEQPTWERVIADASQAKRRPNDQVSWIVEEYYRASQLEFPQRKEK